MGKELAEQARAFYGRLNGLPAAERYLKMFERSVEFHLGDEPCFHFTVASGRVSVAPGPAPAGGECMVMRTDAESLEGLFSARLSYAALGGGYVGRLRCVEGPALLHDLGWVGILTRLAQEAR